MTAFLIATPAAFMLGGAIGVVLGFDAGRRVRRYTAPADDRKVREYWDHVEELKGWRL